jgi:hypothetical protein
MMTMDDRQIGILKALLPYGSIGFNDPQNVDLTGKVR